MLRITMLSLPPQSYDKQTLSESFTFVFPWKDQPLAKQPPYSRGGIQQHPQEVDTNTCCKRTKHPHLPTAPRHHQAAEKIPERILLGQQAAVPQLQLISNIKLFSGP